VTALVEAQAQQSDDVLFDFTSLFRAVVIRNQPAIAWRLPAGRSYA